MYSHCPCSGTGQKNAEQGEETVYGSGRKTVLYYSLQAFEQSSVIEEVILVTDSTEISYCQKEIIERFHFQKVKKIISGGKERYDSVYQGLLSCDNTDYVFIHDSARPMITEEIIGRGYEDVVTHDASVAAVPAKDTIKIGDEQANVKETIDRSHAWIIQTPQVFSFSLITEAYKRAAMEGMEGITDDAMIAEGYSDRKVHLYLGSYHNLKITTPEDLILAEAILSQREK